MYNCENCNRIELLQFRCNDCLKMLCRSCISKDKHKCEFKATIDKYRLDMFCNNETCINLKEKKCKKCKIEYCNTHISNHLCSKKTSWWCFNC